MVQIQAFRGLRYNLSRVGDLSTVVAPPYDVIDSSLQETLYHQNPYNVVRLILNKDEANDQENSKYKRAADFLNDWKKKGVLALEKSPAIYIYHQEFEYAKQRYRRRGFMASVRLEPYGQGAIFPHEETHSRAKEDRLKLLRATATNLSQVFGFYVDEENQVQDLLETVTEDPTPLTATDHLGVTHRLWRVVDEPAIAKAAALMSEKSMYIADGHHRYETACNYLNELKQSTGVDENHPANFVSMMCVASGDDGLVILPTHRLFRNFPALSSGDLIDKLSAWFECERVASLPAGAYDTWQQIERSGQPSTIGLYAAQDQNWILLRINEGGRQRLQEIRPNRSHDWRSLGVSILHELIVRELLAGQDLPAPRYVHSTDEVVSYLEKGDTAGRDATGQQGKNEPFNLAALVMPANVDDICRVSGRGERMPAKSTYFYPKLLSGLVLNPLQP